MTFFSFPGEAAKRWDQIVGLDDVKDWLLNHLACPLQYKRAISDLDVCNGVLFYGPPGTGKSMLSRALASKINIPFIEVLGSNLMSKWHGESENNIRLFFGMAAELAPCIVFIGELVHFF
jgi:SpoVK/Ycf46/Vps4 family AAA+-type ATPase